MKIKNIRLVLLPFIFMFLFTSCLYKNIDGSNNFQQLVYNMVNKSSSKIKKNLALDDVVLVSDFVNLDKLENHSKLGFLLSETLKDALSSHDIIIRQVELGKEFTLGAHGFNLLTREQSRINTNITDSFYALVGTYTVTTKRLIVFIKLIDIRTGDILSSSNDTMIINQEIWDLEKTEDKRKRVFAPVVL